MKKSIVSEVKNKIFRIRGVQVMLDRDLAVLYEVPTKRLNEQVKRNYERFPEDFMFQLSKKEFEILRSQIATPNSSLSKLRYLPYVFTEQGVANLSSILSSKIAIRVNVQIMRAFVAMRQKMSFDRDLILRVSGLESKFLEYDKKFKLVFQAIDEKSIKSKKGIFYDGQTFDAYRFVCDIIRKAKSEIRVIDNYIDESVLMLLSKRKKGVVVKIYCKAISEQLKLDLKKFNSQYDPISIIKFKDSHDRFLIIDNKTVYHFGASLKDLGRKWFAFSKFETSALEMLSKLKKQL